jgi:hypothetical protein
MGSSGGRNTGLFWSRIQLELLDRRRRKIRVELASAILDYIEIVYNRQRRHRAHWMRTSVELATAQHEPVAAA